MEKIGTLIKSSEKFDRIVKWACELTNEQITEGGRKFDNEASFQLFFANILIEVAKLRFIGYGRRFEVELEKIVNLDSRTDKTRNLKARCDIICKLVDVVNKSATSLCYIELKYFHKDSDTITDKRKSVYMDIENLEHYMYDNTGKKKNGISACYMIVVAEDDLFRNEGKHKFSISEGVTISSEGSITLQNSYPCRWDGKMLKINIGKAK